ncbi:MAG: tyrosine-type recombinase/integrase [Methyloglobulus sp.]
MKDKPIRQVNTKAWRNALKRAGITDFRWHDLRQTWAFWHVQNGTPLNALQELGSGNRRIWCGGMCTLGKTTWPTMPKTCVNQIKI